MNYLNLIWYVTSKIQNNCCFSCCAENAFEIIL